MELEMAREINSPLNLQKADSSKDCDERLTRRNPPKGIVRCGMSKYSQEKGKNTSNLREYAAEHETST